METEKQVSRHDFQSTIASWWFEDHLADGRWPIDTQDDSANLDGWVPFLCCWSSNHLSKAASSAKAAQREWSFLMKTVVSTFHSELCFTDEWKEKAWLMSVHLTQTLPPSPPQKDWSEMLLNPYWEVSSKPSESFKLPLLGSSNIFNIKW